MSKVRDENPISQTRHLNLGTGPTQRVGRDPVRLNQRRGKLCGLLCVGQCGFGQNGGVNGIGQLLFVEVYFLPWNILNTEKTAFLLQTPDWRHTINNPRDLCFLSLSGTKSS